MQLLSGKCTYHSEEILILNDKSDSFPAKVGDDFKEALSDLTFCSKQLKIVPVRKQMCACLVSGHTS